MFLSHTPKTDYHLQNNLTFCNYCTNLFSRVCPTNPEVVNPYAIFRLQPTIIVYLSVSIHSSPLCFWLCCELEKIGLLQNLFFAEIPALEKLILSWKGLF